MEFQQLKCFREVVATKNCTQAAANIGMGRTGVRLSIKALEESLEAKLFDGLDSAGEYTLTTEGKILYNYTNQIFAELEEAKQELENISGKKPSVVNVIYNDNLMHTIVPKVCSGYLNSNRCRDVHFNFTLGHSIDDVEKMLFSGAADIAFSQKESTSLNCLPVAQDQLYILLPADHPLAYKRKIRLSEVKHIPFILPTLNYIATDNSSSSSMLNRSIQMMIEAEHINCVYSNLHGTLEARMCYVEAGLGYTITSDFPMNDSKIAKIEIDNPYSTRPVYMLWPKNCDLSFESRKFKDYCVDYFKNRHNMVLK